VEQINKAIKSSGRQYNSKKNKQQEIKEEGEHKNLFTQISLMMTYYGGESSSPFHSNDLSFFTKRYLGLQELVFKPNSS